MNQIFVVEPQQIRGRRRRRLRVVALGGPALIVLLGLAVLVLPLEWLIASFCVACAAISVAAAILTIGGR